MHKNKINRDMKSNNGYKFAESARRANEIKQYGKILSLRPSCTHKSKKDYNRNNKKKEISMALETSFFLCIIYFVFI